MEKNENLWPISRVVFVGVPWVLLYFYALVWSMLEFYSLGLLLIGGIAAIPDSKVERAKASLLILDYEPLPDDGEFFPPQDF